MARYTIGKICLWDTSGTWLETSNHYSHSGMLVICLFDPALISSISFGLSYTNYTYSNLTIPEPTSHDASFSLSVDVTVSNDGDLAGSEVVQLYITIPNNGLTTPKLQLRGFAKAKDINPGESKAVTIHLDKYAVSYWDTPRDLWTARAGKYLVSIGKSSDNIVLEGEFELKKSFDWVGL